MKKPLLYLLIAAVALLFLGFFGAIISSYTGEVAIEMAMRNFGPKLLGAPVELDEAELSIAKGEAALNDLVIGNPEGFKTEYALAVSRVEIDIDPFSIFSDAIRIHSIAVINPTINYETGFKGSNLGRIQNNIDAFSGDEDTKEEEADAMRFIIEDFVVYKGKINLSTPMAAGKTTGMDLPIMRLTNIGEGESGATIQQVASQFFDALLKSVSKAVKASGSFLQKLFGATQDRSLPSAEVAG